MCSVTTLLHMDGVMLRWIVIGCAILTMAACSSGKKPGVDPCTGIDASTDPALQAGDREILRQTLDRQTYWLIHDDLNADRACEAARADDQDGQVDHQRDDGFADKEVRETFGNHGCDAGSGE